MLHLSTILTLVACFLSALPGVFSTSNSDSVSISNFPDAAFTVSTELFAQIVPHDPTQKLFVLPATPTGSTLCKLTYALDSNCKRIGMFSVMVRQFTHYDPISNNMFKSAIESFVTLAQMHKSIQSTGNPEIYSKVSEALNEVIQVLSTFLRNFTTSLLVPRLSEVESFNDIIFDFNNLEGLFYVITHSKNEFCAETLINIVFSAVESVQDEVVVWNYYKRFASPSVCLPLPHEFLSGGHSRGLHLSLVENLIALLTAEDEVNFDLAWLSQLGLLLRLRIITLPQVIELLEVMTSHFWDIGSNSVVHLNNFMRLIFLDELIQPKANKSVVNYLNVPAPEIDPEELKAYYIKIWSLIDSNVSFSEEATVSEFTDMQSLILCQIETKFPGISSHMESKDSDETDLNHLRFLQLMSTFNCKIATQEDVENVIHYLHDNDLDTEMNGITVSNMRLRLVYILGKFIDLVESINGQLVGPSSPSSLNFENLIQALENKIADLKFVNSYIPSFTKESEVLLFVDFAFKLKEMSQAAHFIEFTLARIESNSTLLETFLASFARNLLLRPNFFCLQYTDSQFSKEALIVFFDAILQVPSSIELLQFCKSAYMHGVLDQTRLWAFFENVKSVEGPEFVDIVATITDYSSLNFIQNSHADLVSKAHAEFQLNTVKLFEFLQRFDTELVQSKLLPWICVKLISFESLKPASSKTDQLTEFRNLESTNFSFDETVSISLRLISKFLNSGASTKDLKRVFGFIQKLRTNFTDLLVTSKNRKLSMSTTLCLLVLIIRANESIVSADAAALIMHNYNMKAQRLSVPQVIYKSYSDPVTRSFLLPTLFGLTLDRNDFSYLHDPKMFERMPEVVISTHMKLIIEQMITPEGVDRSRFEAFCFWMSLGLVPLDLAKSFIEALQTADGRLIALKYSISLLRAVFRHEKYRSIRKLATRKLFMDVDHTAISPKPIMSGIIGGIPELTKEKEFLAVVNQKSSLNYHDVQGILRIEAARKERVTKSSLHLSDGIENVLDTYVKHLAQVASFEMSLETKNTVLHSILSNLSRLKCAQYDYLSCACTDSLIDDFVRVSIYLATQIHADCTEPAYSVDFDTDSYDLFFGSIIQYVRDVNVQSLLVFQILGCIKDHQESRLALLDALPRYINWRRFLLLPDSFRFIFNFNGPVDAFDQFMTQIIDAAFRFSDLTNLDAPDFSRDRQETLHVHDNFFSTMSFLITSMNLPTKYIIQILSLLSENAENVDISSSGLIQFLRAAITMRSFDPQSKVYRVTINSYGEQVIFNLPRITFSLVLEFLAKRPDFLTVAFVNNRGSESFKLIAELEELNRKFPDVVEYNQPAIQLIRAIFVWPAGGLESLEWLSRVSLPDSTLRSIVSWISMSSPKTGEGIIPIAMTVLNLVPVSFDFDSFLDSKDTQSWLPIAISIIQWITVLCAESPLTFAKQLTERAVDALLNLFLWSLDCDFKEAIVGTAFVNFLESAVHASETIKAHLIYRLGVFYYRPILMNMRPNASLFQKICATFRKLTQDDIELAKQVEKLSTQLLFNDSSVFSEEAIMAERTTFIVNYQKLENLDEIENLRDFFVDMCTTMAQLRLMNEFDTIFLLLSRLSKITAELYPEEPSERLEELAMCLCLTVKLLRWELLLQADFWIIPNFFKFLFKHAKTGRRAEFIDVFSLLVSQFSSFQDIQALLVQIINDVRLEGCMLPTKGFPKHFYVHTKLMEQFVLSYFGKLNQLGSRLSNSGKVAMDGNHFIILFNILHKSNATDALFIEWIENMSRINDNDLLTIDFAENLKVHCQQRKHLVKFMVPVVLNSAIVTRVLSGAFKETMLAVFSLISKDNPVEYQKQVSSLPINLQNELKKATDGLVNDKKRKLVQDLVDKCELPVDAGFTVESLPSNLLGSLETVLKLDLSVIYSEKSSIFFRRLQVLLEGLNRNVLFDSHGTNILNLIAVGLAIQIKNFITFEKTILRTALRVCDSLTSKPEVFELIAKAAASLTCKFTAGDSTAIIKLLSQVSDPNAAFVQILSGSTANCLQLIKAAVESKSTNIDLSLIVETQIVRLLKQNPTDKLTLLELIKVAVENNLFSKTQLLAIDRLIN